MCIDGTFATPCNLKALNFGADLVIHSASKYMGGHNDVLGGVIVGQKEAVSKVRAFHNIVGGVLDPHAAYLILRGLKTLSLRVERHNSNAQKLAEWLEAHPKISKVHYPGLKSHPDYEVANKYMTGFGLFLLKSMEICGKPPSFIDGMQVAAHRAVFGGVESLIEQPGRLFIGIKDPKKSGD